MYNVFDELKARGLIAQMTHEEEIKALLLKEPVTFYIGFDATADSLHVGHLLQLIVMSHMQKAGHRPIALLGTGTTMVGDPTGKTDMRKMLTKEQIDHNAVCFQRQMERLLDFSEGKAMMLRNGDWLLNLNYIEFLRDVGVHFSVNKMLTAECFKTRLEKGLSFIEFNYMLMQSYDFLHLYRTHHCRLELGGDDQWSNIIGGVELVRKCEREEAYGMTFTLLTTKEGKKMGKTENGAVWLDPAKTSPYEFFQYWRNIDDGDVIRCMKMLTFLPLEEISEIEKQTLSGDGKTINGAKERLAFELTKLVHGEEEAEKAQNTARSLFTGGTHDENMPSTEISRGVFKEGQLGLLDLMYLTKLAASKSEARRLIDQGSVLIDDQKVIDNKGAVTLEQFEKGYVIIRKGKKVFHKAVLVD